MQQNLDDHKLEDDWEVERIVTAQLIAHGTDWYLQGTEKFLSQCDKYFSYGWDYVGKQWRSNAIIFEAVL